MPTLAVPDQAVPVAPDGVKQRRSRTTSRVGIATIAIAALALLLSAAPAVLAGGLRDCPDLTGPGAGHAACTENVWSDGVQARMVFANQEFKGATPGDRVGSFYVIAPQTGTPQGAPPNTFPHDHTVGVPPAQNQGTYRVHLHAYFAVCSELGIVSGACVPTFTVIPGLGTLPFAKTVNGQALTSAAPIEAAVGAGYIALLDTGGVLVATITRS